ncbi:50S ribosomal protein L18 [Candidatus Mycoplasma haematominutum]|uniref:50S ribosomal protein L18 n=1 Tax=Candidatus Mycoplasma haematominutum TaxID=209446 RepID=UPI0024817177|nr:50S ribosomal protein L18 [Candidatus Mycoplasma haematominutum]
MQSRRSRRATKVLSKAREGRKHILRVKKTNLHLYLLVKSPKDGRVLFSASSLQLKIKKGGVENLEKIVASLLEKLNARKIDSLSLDRGYHSYYGTIQKVRERLLENGIKI